MSGPRPFSERAFCKALVLSPRMETVSDVNLSPHTHRHNSRVQNSQKDW